MGEEEAEVVPHCPAMACPLLQQKQQVSRSRNSHIRRKTMTESACCSGMALLPHYCSRRIKSGMSLPLPRCAINISINTPTIKAGSASDRSSPRNCRRSRSPSPSPSPVLRPQKRRRHRRQQQQQNPPPPSQCFSPWPDTMDSEGPQAIAGENQPCCDSPTHAPSSSSSSAIAACPPPPSKPARKARTLLHSSSSSRRKKKFFIPSNLDELPPFLQSLFA